MLRVPGVRRTGRGLPRAHIGCPREAHDGQPRRATQEKRGHGPV